MRKISLVLASAAGLAFVAGAAAAPAVAQVHLGLSFGPSTYYQPYSGYNAYRPYYGYNNGYYADRRYDGYNSGYYSRPSYRTYSNRGYTTYGYPTYNTYYTNPSSPYNAPGYFGR